MMVAVFASFSQDKKKRFNEALKTIFSYFTHMLEFKKIIKKIIVGNLHLSIIINLLFGEAEVGKILFELNGKFRYNRFYREFISH